MVDVARFVIEPANLLRIAVDDRKARRLVGVKAGNPAAGFERLRVELARQVHDHRARKP